MYSPTAWKTFANIIIPQMAEAVEGETSMNETAIELAELLAQMYVPSGRTEAILSVYADSGVP